VTGGRSDSARARAESTPMLGRPTILIQEKAWHKKGMDDGPAARCQPDPTGSLDRPPSDRLLRLSEVTRETVPWFPSTSIPTLQRYTKHAVRGRRVLRTVL